MNVYYTQAVQDLTYLSMVSPARQSILSGIRNQKQLLCSLTGDLLLQLAIREVYGNLPDLAIREVTQTGKPYFPALPNFHFSISHTDSLVGCAVDTQPVGLDLQYPRKQVHKGVLQRYFTPAEQEKVEANPAQFWKFWTQKEAIVKQSGIGLSGKIQTLSCLSPITEWDGVWYGCTSFVLPDGCVGCVSVAGKTVPVVTRIAVQNPVYFGLA